MKTVTMLEFRKDAEKILRQVQQGERLVLTYRGKPVIRLEPITGETANEDDPFYALYRYAEDTGEALSNRDMDAIIYGS